MSLRLLHLGKLYPPDRGGIETVTEALAVLAADDGYDARVLALGRQARTDEVRDGVAVMRVPEGYRVKAQALSPQYILKAISEVRKADIIHIHWPNALAGVVAGFIPSDKKVVLHWHSDIVNKGRFYDVVKPFEASLVRRADRIICTTDRYAAASAPLKDVQHKVSSIPLFCDDPRLEKQAEEDVGAIPEEVVRFINGRRVVLAVGRLVPYKGYETFLEAVAKVESDDLAFIIVGSGVLEEALKAQAESLGLSHKLCFLKNLSYPTLKALRQASDIYVMSSVMRSEAFGVVLIEAMAEGIPVIATDIDGSGVPWVNADGVSGLNVPVGDAQALAGAIDTLATDQATYARLAAGSRRRFETVFARDVVAEQYLDMYKGLSLNVGEV